MCGAWAGSPRIIPEFKMKAYHLTLSVDGDGKPDNPKILEALLEAQAAIVMTKTQGEGRRIPRGSRPRGQGLYGEETRPNAKAEGVFDGALEEILHMVSDHGWGGAYPSVKGKGPSCVRDTKPAGI